MKKLIKIILALFVMVLIANAQTSFKQMPDSNIKINGTSNLHDWTMEASNPACEATFTLNDKGDLTAINSLKFSVVVKTLKSDKSGLDKNAYNALNADKHDKITYTMTSAGPVKASGNSFEVKTTGNLSIAGTTQRVELTTVCVKNANGTYTCTGSQPLKMTDYKVEPPTFMFGAMKTGNEVSIDYIINLKK